MIACHGCYAQQNNNPKEERTIIPISFTKSEKEISELTLAYLMGYEFDHLGEAEIRINLVHDGQLIQNYESFFSYEIN